MINGNPILVNLPGIRLFLTSPHPLPILTIASAQGLCLIRVEVVAGEVDTQ